MAGKMSTETLTMPFPQFLLLLMILCHLTLNQQKCAWVQIVHSVAPAMMFVIIMSMMHQIMDPIHYSEWLPSISLLICCHFLVMHSVWFTFITSAILSFTVVTTKQGHRRQKFPNASETECCGSQTVYNWIHRSVSVSMGRMKIHSIRILYVLEDFDGQHPLWWQYDDARRQIISKQDNDPEYTR